VTQGVVSGGDCPEKVGEFAAQAVAYVTRAIGVTLEYDSDTLPILDHYLGMVPKTDVESTALVAATAGAYFGEVVRRRLGGRWDLSSGDPGAWRLVLPGGLSLMPAAAVMAGMLRDEGIDPGLDAPAAMRPVLEQTLEQMAEVSEEMYYSLGGRLDTLEHLQAVLLATAAHKVEQQAQEPESDA
jgi:hypothetical protein